MTKSFLAIFVTIRISHHPPSNKHKIQRQTSPIFRALCDLGLTADGSTFASDTLCCRSTTIRAGHAVSSTWAMVVDTVGTTICVSVNDMQLRIIIRPTMAQKIIDAMIYRCGTDFTTINSIVSYYLIWWLGEGTYGRQHSRRRQSLWMLNASASMNEQWTNAKHRAIRHVASRRKKKVCDVIELINWTANWKLISW